MSKRIIIEIPEFAEALQDLIPYTMNFDDRRIVQCIVDDLNGLLNLSEGLTRSEEVDMRKISNTLEYIVKDAEDHVSERSMRDMRDVVCRGLNEMFEEIRVFPGWVNMRFKYVSHRISRRDCTIRLEGHSMFNYSHRICELQMDAACKILEKYSVKDDRRY